MVALRLRQVFFAARVWIVCRYIRFPCGILEPDDSVWVLRLDMDSTLAWKAVGSAGLLYYTAPQAYSKGNEGGERFVQVQSGVRKSLFSRLLTSIRYRRMRYPLRLKHKTVELYGQFTLRGDEWSW